MNARAKIAFFILGILLAVLLSINESESAEIVISSGVDCTAVTYVARTHCVTFTANGQPVGDDVTGDGTAAHPWATLQKALDYITTAYGTGAGHTLTVYPGAYDTVNGLRTTNGNDTRIPTGGTSFASDQVFTIRVPGASSGARAVFYIRPNSGVPIGEIQAGVHFPTEEQCAFNRAVNGGVGYGPAYPSQCVGGATSPGFLWEVQDDNNAVFGVSVINISGTNDHKVKFVVFDGIILDGRGVALNTLTSGGDSTGHVLFHDIQFKNGEFRNSAGSCFNQPGVDNSIPGGGTQTDNWTFTDFKVHHCGIPFDTYIMPVDRVANGGTDIPARESTAAKYLHGFYLHVGGDTCLRCETYLNAGSGLSGFALVENSYIHDNAFMGVQGVTTLRNSVFYNNGGLAIQSTGLTENNTIIAGTKGKNSTQGGTSRDGSRGIEIIEWEGGAVYQNNIIDGFDVGIANYACHPWNGNSGTEPTHCYVTARNTIRNNVINVTSGKEIVNAGAADGVSIVLPTTGGNIYASPLFNSGSGNSWPLQSTSPAINAGFQNSLTTDYNGSSRDSNPDIGAFEFGGAVAVNTIIDSTTPSTFPTINTQMVVAFHGTGGSGTGFTYQCNLDSAGYSTCTSPKTYSGLSVASHTLLIRATDSLSATDATPASLSWTIVTPGPPDTAITSQPSSPTTSTTAAFNFSCSANSGACTFTCSLDGAAFTTCSTGISYTGLAVGSHTFDVKAFDTGTSLTDQSPAGASWIITQTGGGVFDVGQCVQVIQPVLNVLDSWATGNFVPGSPQIQGAIGKIVNTSTVTNGQGFTGIRVDYMTGIPTVDGWHSTNPINLSTVACPSGSKVTLKIGGSSS